MNLKELTTKIRSKATELWKKLIAFLKSHNLFFSVLGVSMILLISAFVLTKLQTPDVTPPATPTVVSEAKPTSVDPMVLPGSKPSVVSKPKEKSKNLQVSTDKSTKYKVEEQNTKSEGKIEEPDPLTLLPEYREALQTFEAVSNPKGSK